LLPTPLALFQPGDNSGIDRDDIGRQVLIAWSGPTVGDAG
jgi:hypothetical protein